MAIKSFRGMIDSSLLNDAQDIISLHTNTGSIGYRIVKLDVMPNLPGAVNTEGVVKVYSLPQTTIDGTIDFSDNSLLAAAYYTQYNAVYGSNSIIQFFENQIFNQDIYVVYHEVGGVAQNMNYYIELETAELALDENTVATLKDIRNIKGR